MTQSTIKFILNGKITELTDCDPTRSVLHYLREQVKLTGTKEGCNEGDCGACTVVLAELVEDQLELRSINACLMFVPMLHGKALFTVESLSSRSGPLHPVQQAMLESHASQCGFCTPGFVMSLFALYKTCDRPERNTINDALSGNLCRCTGYRPIIDAAYRMYDLAVEVESDWINQPVAAQDENLPLIKQLRQIQVSDILHIQYQNRQYFAPVSLQELLKLKNEIPQSTLVAGNTDVGLWVNKKLQELSTVISLNNVNDLSFIEVTDDEITIGARVSLEQAYAELVQYFPGLDELYRRFASLPIRNAGTLVGNIANGSPIGDTMPALLVLDAEVILTSVDHSRRLSLHRFYLDYMKKDLQADEVVKAVSIPRISEGYTLACYKISKRYDQDISAVCAAFCLKLNSTGQVEHVRIALGGMAAIPARAYDSEQFLLGKTWGQECIDQAKIQLAEEFKPLSDMRASGVYRNRVVQNLLQRFYLQTDTSEQDIPLQLTDLEEVSA